MKKLFNDIRKESIDGIGTVTILKESDIEGYDRIDDLIKDVRREIDEEMVGDYLMVEVEGEGYVILLDTELDEGKKERTDVGKRRTLLPLKVMTNRTLPMKHPKGYFSGSYLKSLYNLKEDKPYSKKEVWFLINQDKGKINWNYKEENTVNV